MLLILKHHSSKLTIFSVFLAILLGINQSDWFAPIQFLGDLFIHLLKAFALPLIFSALIAAVGDLAGNLKGLRQIARNAVGYMILSEIIAVSIALFLFNFFKPGTGLNPDLILHGKQYVPTPQDGFNFPNFVLSIFPHNVFESLSKFELLPVVVFAILFGMGCSVVGERAKPVVSFAVAVREICTTCLHGVMLFAPVGIFALVGNGVAQAHLSGNLYRDFQALLSFVLVLMVGLFLHALWQLVLMTTLTGQKLLTVLKESVPVFTTAFGTSSSVATLPLAMDTADRLKAESHVSRFMLPLCASVNVGGMMMYEVGAALFFSQVLGLDLSLGDQALLALGCILGGMAEGGIPETSLVSLVVVFKIVNVPLSAISILLPLDRIIDRMRTMVNIFGNLCGVVVVSRISSKQTCS